jgi:hypothetical protein
MEMLNGMVAIRAASYIAGFDGDRIRVFLPAEPNVFQIGGQLAQYFWISQRAGGALRSVQAM